MTKYVAFLRGINVGGRIVRMADLKTCFESLGFQAVTTILQTGNVLFESRGQGTEVLKRKAEAAISQKFGYVAKVQIVKADGLNDIITSYPFDSSDERFQHYVVFLENELAAALANEATDLDKMIEAIKSGDKVIYWRVQKGMTTISPFSKYLTKSRYREFNTVRNIKTLKKVIAAGQV